MPSVPKTDPPSSSPDPDPQRQNDESAEESDAALTQTLRQREDLEQAPFWKEVSAFNQLPQSQIDEYYGQYVAVYQGNIVDADPDEGELALRFYRTFGYVPVYIHKVGTEEGLVDEADLES